MDSSPTGTASIGDQVYGSHDAKIPDISEQTKLFNEAMGGKLDNKGKKKKKKKKSKATKPTGFEGESTLSRWLCTIIIHSNLFVMPCS